jgi:glycine/D-amino acid oxidase-like deaminating enzyme
MSSKADVAVIGAGAFGVCAAIELRARGARVELIDPGPLPHPDASSTDISKAVRMDYGADTLYTELGERSIERWRECNRRWGETLYHETGFLLMARSPLVPGTYEGDCYDLLRRRGHHLERIDRSALQGRFSAWRADEYRDGYYNPAAGWVESAAAVARLIEDARVAGVMLREGESFAGLIERGSRVTGVRLANGSVTTADHVVLATGAWTPGLLPELEKLMWASGQPVFHFRPEHPELFEAERFPMWGADISQTGWYGFPLNADGVVKVANHGPGQRIDPRAPRRVDPSVETTFREFLRSTFPDLADALLVGSRLCLYCDTWDGNFWIDRHPRREGLIVAAGGSGHGFKFAPVLGEIIADVLEQKPNPYARRFAWRDRGERNSEQARKT